MSEKNKFLIQYYLIDYFRNIFLLRQYMVLVLSNYLDPLQIGSIMSVYHIVDLLFEIPMGLLANKIGCKKTLLWTMFLFLASYFLVFFDKSAFAFVVFFFFFGLYDATYYSVKDNIIYNNIKHHNLKDTFPKHKLMTKILSSVALSVGAFMATKVFKTAGGHALIVIDGILFSLYMYNILQINENAGKNLTLLTNNATKSLISGIRYIFKHNTLRKFLLFQVTWSSVNSIIMSYCSLFYSNIFSTNTDIGNLMSIQILIVAIMQTILINKLMKLSIFKTCFVFVVSGISIMLSTTIYSGLISYVFVILYYLCTRIGDALTYTTIQSCIPSKFRTIVVSVADLCESFVNSVLLWIFGFLAKSYSYRVSLNTISCFFAVCSVVFLISCLYDKHLWRMEKRRLLIH